MSVSDSNLSLQTQRLLNLLAESVHARHVDLCLYDGKRLLVVYSTQELGPESFYDLPCRFDQGDPDPLVVADLAEDLRSNAAVQARLAGTGMLVAAPLLDYEESAFGFVCVRDLTARRPSDADIRLIERFARALSEEMLRGAIRGRQRFTAAPDLEEDWTTEHALDGSLTKVSGGFERLTGIRAEEAARMRLEDLVDSSDREMLRQILIEQFGGGSSRVQRIRIRGRDGSYCPVEVQCRVRFANGEIVGYETRGRLVAAENQRLPQDSRTAQETTATEALDLLSRQRPLSEVLQQVAQTAVHRYSDAAACILVRSAGVAACAASEGFPGWLCRLLELHLQRIGAWSLSLAAGAEQAAVGPPPGFFLEVEGAAQWWQQQAFPACASIPVKTGERLIGFLLVFGSQPSDLVHGLDRDLCIAARLVAVAVEQETLRARVSRLAEYDLLTGLPNRRGVERLLPAFLAARGEESGAAAIILLSIQGLRRLRDVYGHQISERILQAVSARLLAAAPPGTLLGRTGSDEFLLAVPVEGSEAEAMEAATQIQSLLREPLDVEGKSHYLMASAGVSLWPADSPHAGELLQMAEAALVQGRRSGRGRLCRYGKQGVLVSERLRTETALHQALERGELRMLFQPQVDLNGAIVGLEALLTWQREGGIPAPAADFIGIAEECGLIIPIGRWVLEESCRQFQRWVNAGYHPGILAVNVSALEFEHPDFTETVANIVRSTGVDPRCLELEITERVVLTDLEAAGERMRYIAESGVRFALDDFGTGYSSLSYLKGLPVHTIKIDRSFVEQIDKPSGTLPLIHTLVIMSHNLGMRTVAEGVENIEQWDLLRAARCDCMQGFLFGKALTPERLSRILQAGAPLGRRAD